MCFIKEFIYFRIGRCQAETTGDNVTQGLFFWKTTDALGMAYSVCPYGLTGGDLKSESKPWPSSSQPLPARRNCICTNVTCKNPKWDKPITIQCNYKTFNDSNTTQHLSGLLQVRSNCFTATREFKYTKSMKGCVAIPQKSTST